MPPLAPPVLHALAQIRATIRDATPQQLGLLYFALIGLAGDALSGVATITAYGETQELGHLSKVSQGPVDGHSPEGRVIDTWIKPQEAALRLGRSERWLRRRRSKSPYSSFCIAGDSGRGYRVSLRGLETFMERERARGERVRVSSDL